jgi:amino acid permease
MAKTTVKKKNIRTAKRTYSSPFGIYWEKKNYLFLFIGFALLIVGYFVMSLGEWNSTTALYISPVILFIAYFFIFPYSIFYRKKEAKEEIKPAETNTKA